MRVISVTLRSFRTYERATAPIGGGLTVIHGPNGAGKTNLLEAIYFGCTGRSFRTVNDRELLSFGADTARVEVVTDSETGRHTLSAGFTPGEAKRLAVDGSPVDRLLDASERPLISVFLPDRLELVKGVPAVRRAHLDQVVAGMWPARVANRRAYAAALAQRNALLNRAKTGAAQVSSLDTWDLELARRALPLMEDRRLTVEVIATRFEEVAGRLGLDGDPAIAYRPRSHASSPGELADELRARRDTDLERGFTGHGPHRDDLLISREDRELRTYGSQGQQRLGLLSLLIAERDAVAAQRGAVPLLLLDDVMSELDHDHRAALVEMIAAGGGQTVITTTDLEHVPQAGDAAVARVAIDRGELLEEISAEAMTG
jgi:DNA replication and repair protein RecF